VLGVWEVLSPSADTSAAVNLDLIRQARALASPSFWWRRGNGVRWCILDPARSRSETLERGCKTEGKTCSIAGIEFRD
jgi:hypothetical protein